MCYGYVHEGYASYGFCFDNNEKSPSLELNLNHVLKKNGLKIFAISSRSLLTFIDGFLEISKN